MTDKLDKAHKYIMQLYRDEVRDSGQDAAALLDAALTLSQAMSRVDEEQFWNEYGPVRVWQIGS